jgi:L-threonylcarbamoyladenylate synthase
VSEPARALERCIAAGGVALFGADTVYGLACDPENPDAVKRLYALKGRPAAKPSAVMWFGVEQALQALPELGPRTREALSSLLPGGLTVLVPNPAHWFPLACANDRDTLGIRVPEMPELAGAECAVLQSSANLAGGPDARRLKDVPEAIRAGVDLVLDRGELPGVASTVIDLRAYEANGSWSVVRAGAVPEAELRRVLVGPSRLT